MGGWTSELQFSWNGTMLQTDVMNCSYVTQQFFVPCNFIANCTCYKHCLRGCYITMLRYMSVRTSRTLGRTTVIAKCSIPHPSTPLVTWYSRWVCVTWVSIVRCSIPIQNFNPLHIFCRSSSASAFAFSYLRNSDLIPIHYFLWNYLKNRAYEGAGAPATLVVQIKIKVKIWAINVKVSQHVFQILLKLASACTTLTTITFSTYYRLADDFSGQ